MYVPRRTVVPAYKAAVCGGDLTTARKSALDLIHSKLFYIQNTQKYSFTRDVKDRMIMTTQSLLSSRSVISLPDYNLLKTSSLERPFSGLPVVSSRGPHWRGSLLCVGLSVPTEVTRLFSF